MRGRRTLVPRTEPDAMVESPCSRIARQNVEREPGAASRASPLLGVCEEPGTDALSAVPLRYGESFDIDKIRRSGNTAVEHKVGHDPAEEHAWRA